MDTTRKKKHYPSLISLTLAIIFLITDTLQKKLAKSAGIPYKILKSETIPINGSLTSTFSHSSESNNSLFIILPKKGKLQKFNISLIQPFSGKTLQSFTCSGFSDIICPLNLPKYSSEFSIKIKNLNNFTAENFTLVLAEYFPNLVEDSSKFSLDGISKGRVKIAVSFEKIEEILGRNLDVDDYRIKFLMEKNSLTENRDRAQPLRIQNLRNNMNETGLAKDQDFLEFESGIVKTHTTSKHCPSKNCVYFLTLEFKNIKKINFVTRIQKYEMLIPFNDDISIITDEVTPTKNLIFQFEKEKQSNWEFVLIPLTHNPDLFINTSIKTPQNQVELEKYNWVSKQVQNQERIIITKKECKKKNSDCKGFYVVVKSTGDESACFTLVVKSSVSDNPQYFLDMNIPFSGRVENGEMLQFLVDLDPKVPEVLRADFELLKTSEKGNPDLYVKDCAQVEGCLITLMDIVDHEKLSKSKKSFFAFSDSEGSLDRIYVEMNVKPVKSWHEFNNHHYTSKFNKIAVAVKGNRKESAFMLSFKAKSPHKRLQEEFTQKFSIPQGQKKHFIFSTYRPLDDIKSLLFRFRVHSGKAFAYISQQNKYPNSNSNDQSQVLLPQNIWFYNLATPAFNITRNINNRFKLKGTYYLTIEATENCFLSIETEYEQKNSSLYRSKKLRVGQVYDRVIVNKSSFMREGTFDEYRFTIQDNYDEESEYTIKLTNLVGKVEMCVEARYTDFKNSESCTDYESLIANEVYSFSSRDSKVWESNEIHVKISPANFSSKEILKNLNFHYRIEVARVGDISDLQIGDTQYGALKRGKPHFFKIQFPFVYFNKFVSVNFQAYQTDPKIKAKIRMRATLDPKNEHLQNRETRRTVIGDRGNLIFSLKDLRKYCNKELPVFDEPEIADNNKNRRALQFLGPHWKDRFKPKKDEKWNKTNPDYDLNTTVKLPKYYSEFCTIHIKLENYNTNLVKYRVSPINVDTTLRLPNGTLNFYPAPSHEVIKFIYDLTNQKEDISVNFYTEYNKLHVKVELYDYSEYVRNPFNVKAVVITGRGQVTLDVSEFSKTKLFSPYALITVHDPKLQKKRWYEPFNQNYFLGIKVSSKVEFLLPSELSHKKGSKGEFTYFIVEANITSSLLISLNVDGEGDADMYVNPGKMNFSSADKYFKKSTGISDDEVSLTVLDHLKNFNLTEKKFYYTIGVYVYRDCEYDIIAIQGIKLIKAHNGDKFTLRTSLKEPLIFELENSNFRKTIDFVYWSEDSILSIFVSKYSMLNDTMNQKTGKFNNELLEKIPTPFNYEKTDSSLMINRPRRVSIPTLERCPQCNFLVSIYPKDMVKNNTMVHFMKFSKYSLIKLRTGELVGHVLYKEESQDFSFVGDLKILELKILILVTKGEVELSTETYELDGGSSKKNTWRFKAEGKGIEKYKELVLSGKNQNSNLKKNIYFTVKALEDSEFKIKARSNSEDRYMRLIPGRFREYKMRKYRKTIKDVLFYFKNSEKSGLKNATIDIIDQKEKYSDIEIYKMIKFKNQTLLKKNVDYFVTQINKNLKISIIIQGQGGIFGIKFKGSKRTYMKMRLSFNNFKSLYINSKETIVLKPGESEIYQLGVPGNGIWGYSFLSCDSGFKIYTNLENEPKFTDFNLIKDFNKPASEFKKSAYVNSQKTSVIFMKIVYEEYSEITQDVKKSKGASIVLNSHFKQFGSRYYDSKVEIQEQVSNSSLYYDGYSRRTKEVFFKVEYPTIASSLLRRYPDAKQVSLHFKYRLKEVKMINFSTANFFQNYVSENNKTKFCEDISLLDFKEEDVKIFYRLNPTKRRFEPTYIKYSGGIREKVKFNKKEKDFDYWKGNFFIDRISVRRIGFNVSGYYFLDMTRKLEVRQDSIEVGEFFLSQAQVLFSPQTYFRTNENTTGGKFNPGGKNGNSDYVMNLFKGLIYGILLGGVGTFLVWGVLKCRKEVNTRRAFERSRGGDSGVEFEDSRESNESEETKTGIEMI